MDNEFQTTFIPKKPLAEERVKSSAAKRPLGIFTMLATLIFVITLLVFGGFFLYERSLSTQIESSRESLKRAEAAFEPSLIVELQELDTRLRTANTLLSQHISVSPIFKILENNTLKSVQYNDLAYTFEGEKGTLEMTGIARRYQAIAEQSVLFGENRFISDHIFSDFSLTEEGLVSFSVVLTISPELVYFERSLGEVDEETVDEEETEQPEFTPILPANAAPVVAPQL